MQNRSIVPIGIIGLIVIGFTIAGFFLLEIERVTVNIWAISFLLFSQLALFAGLIGIRATNNKHNNVFLKAGITTSLFLYFVITLISVLFAGRFSDNLNLFILIELAIIAVFAIIIISVLAWSRSIARRNEADLAKVGTNEPKRGGF
ncbi:MAG: hypothetical protein FWC66_04245 [Oscillospiraceae bacterium]|nr:hypothetical protein [Oscillospiraceae bacterium]